MKQKIRLTESDLHNMIAEAIKEALNEDDNTKFQFDGNVYKCVLNALNDTFGKEQVSSTGTGMIVTNPEAPEIKIKIDIAMTSTQNITGFHESPFRGINAQSGFQRTPFNNK